MSIESTSRSLYLIKPEEGTVYAPKNHTGTANRRIVSQETVGARNMEILIGTISKGMGALPHAHPQLEQFGYLLSGAGISEVDGKEEVVAMGQWSLLPKGAFHKFTVTSEEPARIVVVYAPPYREDPAATILASSHPGAKSATRRSYVAPTLAPTVHRTSLQTVIACDATVAENVEILVATVSHGDTLALPFETDAEQALYVERGVMNVTVGTESVVASEGNWVYVAAGASAKLTAINQAGGHAHVIRGFKQKQTHEEKLQ